MISGKILRDAIISGANNINNQRSRVDELNVFPVPDGDTGTNMGMTVGSAVRELQAMDDSCTVGEAAKTAASAMLRGARGNSGVITSLLFRGFSKALEGKKEADTADIVAALKKGVEGAYKAVMKPTEGTILTVARVAAEKSRTALTDTMEPLEIWDLIIQYAEEALAQTPEQLPVLKKAGVVDAGGQGLVYILKGMRQVFAGEGVVPGIAGDTAAAPAEEPVIEVPAEEAAVSAAEPVSETAAKPAAKKAARKTAVKKPAAKKTTTRKTAAKATTKKAAEKAVEKPTEKAAEKPVEEPAEEPVKKTAAKTMAPADTVETTQPVQPKKKGTAKKAAK